MIPLINYYNGNFIKNYPDLVDTITFGLNPDIFLQILFWLPTVLGVIMLMRWIKYKYNG
jgi:hypothetical protein